MSGARRTWDMDDFGGGIDLRDGLWSRNQSRWRELKNCRTTKGRKVRRRAPVLKDDIVLDAACQGLLAIDGTYFVIAKKGDVITHTGAAADMVSTLYFDSPDLCTTWELGEFGVFNGQATAWIIHTFPSATYQRLAIKHVWDGLVFAPTYVQDPYLPGSFSPSIADLTDQRYDPDFRPVLGAGASKDWTSTIRGNAHCCRTADARIWNQRTLEGLKADGEHYCFVVPEGALAVRSFLVPRNASWMAGDGRWAYYVLEYAQGTAWVPMAEVSVAPTAAFTWRPVATASRFAGGWDEIAVQVCWGSAQAGLIRLRLVAAATAVDVPTEPTVEATAGTGALWKLSVGAAKYQYRGADSVTRAAYVTADLSEGHVYLLGVSADEVGFPTLVDITTTFPNGWEREHRRFFKRITTTAAATGTTEAEATWAGAYARYTAGHTEMEIDAVLAALVIVGSVLRVSSISYKVSVIAGQIVTVTNLAGTDADYTANLNALKTVYKTNDPVIDAYQYAYEDDAESSWYTNLVVEYVDLVGAEDALSISTAAQDNTGGTITAIRSVRNRILITYADSMQLWSIDQDTNKTAHLDSLSFGTGSQANPSPVAFYGSIVVPTADGFRSVSVVGANTDNLQDSKIGEPVATLPDLAVRSATFWPWYGELVVAGIRDGALVFQVLDYSRESKITAWCQWDGAAWEAAGLADMDPGTLIADGSVLRWRSGTSIYHFDAAATVFRDWCDVPGAAYESRGRMHYNDMSAPGKGKRFVGFDIVQEGSCCVGFDVPPYGSWDPDFPGQPVAGSSYGRSRLPMAMTGPAVAPVFTSRDETGWELQRFAIDFLTLRR